MISKKIAQKIKLERVKIGWSQEELALNANLSRTAIQKIETGKSSPTIDTLEKIANAFKIDFQTFVDTSKIDL